MKRPELLSPAGDWPSLKAAVAGGADSVYFGVKTMNMRHMAANFDGLEIKEIMRYLKEKGKKGYLALNRMVMENELKKVERILRQAQTAEVDAVILWDMAVLSLASEMGLPIHLSTQASVANSRALDMFARLGVTRVILARECSLDQIKTIKKNVRRNGLDCTIEVFIHGAMCVSLSGRCFLSAYAHGLSANKGQCWQPCRREYKIQDVDEEMEFIVGQDYILSPKDLCTLDFIDELMDAGIDSFKIEGRMRSAEYTRTVTEVYREAIDLHASGQLTPKKKEELMPRLKEVYNRGFSPGFYFGNPSKDISRTLAHQYKKQFLGEVTRYFKKIGVAEIKLFTGGLRKGDQIVFIGKSTPADKTRVEEMQLGGRFIERAEKGGIVGLKLPFTVRPKDKVFHWVKKD